MGLFSRKRKLEAPAPPSDSLLRFPKPPQREVHPEEIKQAVKTEKAPEKKLQVILPTIEKQVQKPVESGTLPSPKPQMPRVPFPLAHEPFFLRIQNHQLLMEHLEKIKSGLADLDKANQELTCSEFNENKDYERFKEDLKKVHDRLLLIESAVFKR